MGASLIIRGADFSENGIPLYDLEGTLSMDDWNFLFSPTSGRNYTFLNLKDETGTSMWTPKAVGVEVLLTGGTEFKVVKYKVSDGTTSELGTFNVDAGVKKMYILDTEVTLTEGEYIGISFNGDTGVTFKWSGTNLLSNHGRFIQVATTTTTTNTGNVPVNVVVSKNW